MNAGLFSTDKEAKNESFTANSIVVLFFFSS